MGLGLGCDDVGCAPSPWTREWRDVLVKNREWMHRLVPRALAQTQPLPVLGLVPACARACRRGQRGPSRTQCQSGDVACTIIGDGSVVDIKRDVRRCRVHHPRTVKGRRGRAGDGACS